MSRRMEAAADPSRFVLEQPMDAAPGLVWRYNNGSADFFNTGQISMIELPLGATLESGAEQAGLGSVGALYGNVFNATTVDDPNTNWDFGNNGGGFNPPPVPEPASAALFLAGLGALSFLTTRRRRG